MCQSLHQTSAHRHRLLMYLRMLLIYHERLAIALWSRKSDRQELSPELLLIEIHKMECIIHDIQYCFWF